MIQENPNVAAAYFYRGAAYADKTDYGNLWNDDDNAIADWNKAIWLKIQQNPKVAAVYKNRKIGLW
jgi:hypothetical protein